MKCEKTQIIFNYLKLILYDLDDVTNIKKENVKEYIYIYIYIYIYNNNILSKSNNKINLR